VYVLVSSLYSPKHSFEIYGSRAQVAETFDYFIDNMASTMQQRLTLELMHNSQFKPNDYTRYPRLTFESKQILIKVATNLVIYSGWIKNNNNILQHI